MSHEEEELELEEGEDSPENLTKIEEKFRTIGLFGEINEEVASEVIFGIHSLAMDTEPGNNNIELMISSPGGHASEMFAIYDIMRYHRELQPIETFAIGKVMSAGVLILAAGTKGLRRIGKHCRVMLHQCSAGSLGTVSTLRTEMKEISSLQDQYFNALAEETNLTVAQIRRLVAKNQNIYFSAEQAVEYGIADVIV
tara:strand:- start:2758 stop:3348 length:591 start_codon:yes stop_codon:yes gene_type:complete